MGLQDVIFKELIKNFSDKEKKWWIKFGNTFLGFGIAIAKIIASIWIAFRILDRVGFEKTVIILLIMISFGIWTLIQMQRNKKPLKEIK